MYNGMMGILGDDSPKGEESLAIEVLFRKLCTSLIQRTRSLDILLLANAYINNYLPSWVIDWRSAKAQVWSKALYYVEKVENNRLFIRGLSNATPITKTGTLLKRYVGGHH
jgi:hypothetical protein